MRRREAVHRFPVCVQSGTSGDKFWAPLPTNEADMPVLLAQDDEALARAAGHDPAALGTLHARHHGALVAFCRSVTRDAADAEDAAQEAWLRAHDALRGETAPARFRPWLFAVARNAALDRLRTRARMADALDVTEIELAGRDDVEAAAFARDDWAAVAADVRRLPDRQRRALVLRELAGLGWPEVGAELGVSATRAESLAADARQSLGELARGRGLACEDVRGRLGRVGAPSRRLRAHLAACPSCAGFDRRRRGSALSSRLLAPLGLLRVLAERFAAGGDGVAIVAKPAAVGAVALLALAAPRPHHHPASRPHGGKQQATAIASRPAQSIDNARRAAAGTPGRPTTSLVRREPRRHVVPSATVRRSVAAAPTRTPAGQAVLPQPSRPPQQPQVPLQPAAAQQVVEHVVHSVTATAPPAPVAAVQQTVEQTVHRTVDTVTGLLTPRA
jgi:RNA polymerase sigma factor (sigma-70 family)